MNHQSIDDGLKLSSSNQDGPNSSKQIPALKIWVNKTLHLIPDLDGLGNNQTTPMNPGNTYTLNFTEKSIKNKYDRILAKSSHPIKMRPDKGFYIGSFEQSHNTTPSAIATGGILKYLGNNKNTYETFDLGKITKNVRLEFSARTDILDLEIIYFDDSHSKSLATINLGRTIHIHQFQEIKDIYEISTFTDFTEFVSGKWTRYRLDFYGNKLRIFYSTDGTNFIQKSFDNGSRFISRTDDNNSLFLKVKNKIFMDNIEITELSDDGQILEDPGKIMDDRFENSSTLDNKYEVDITNDKNLK